MKEGRRNSYAAQNEKKRETEKDKREVKRGRRSAKGKAWNGRANDHAREEETKQKKKGRGKRGTVRSSRAQHVTGVVNISLAFVLRRPTDVAGFIYALRYTPVQPVVEFLLLTRRSYP